MTAEPWTPEREQLLTELWPQLISRYEIAERLGGFNYRRVLKKAKRLGLPEIYMAKGSRITWTPERIKTLKTMWAANITAQKISEAIGGNCSRSIVIGKAHRLGLQNRGKLWTKAPGRGHRKERKAPQIKEVQCSAKLVDLPTDQSLDAISLFDIRPNQCRWPLNNTSPISEFLFCGAVKDWGKSYCNRHNHIAYRNVAATNEQRQAQQRYRLLKRFPLPSSSVVGWDAA